MDAAAALSVSWPAGRAGRTQQTKGLTPRGLTGAVSVGVEFRLPAPQYILRPFHKGSHE